MRLGFRVPTKMLQCKGETNMRGMRQESKTGSETGGETGGETRGQTRQGSETGSETGAKRHYTRF